MHIHVCTHTRKCMHMCTHARHAHQTQAHTHIAHMHTHARAYVHTCVHARTCVYTRVYVCSTRTRCPGGYAGALIGPCETLGGTGPAGGKEPSGRVACCAGSRLSSTRGRQLLRQRAVLGPAAPARGLRMPSAAGEQPGHVDGIRGETRWGGRGRAHEMRGRFHSSLEEACIGELPCARPTANAGSGRRGARGGQGPSRLTPPSSWGSAEPEPQGSTGPRT